MALWAWLGVNTVALVPWTGTFAGTGGFPLRPGTLTVGEPADGSTTVALAFEDGGFNGQESATWEGSTLRFTHARVACALTPVDGGDTLAGTCTEVLTVEGRAPISMPQAFTRANAAAPWWSGLMALPTPEGWNALAAPDGTLDLVSPDVAAHVTLRAGNVHDDAPPLSVVEKDVLSALQARHKGIRVVRRGNTRLDGEVARQLDLSFTENGEARKMVVLVCVHRPLRVVMEVVAPASGFDARFKKELLPVVRGLHFKR
jgi:hypothetical protein